MCPVTDALKDTLKVFMKRYVKELMFYIWHVIAALMQTIKNYGFEVNMCYVTCDWWLNAGHKFVYCWILCRYVIDVAVDIWFDAGL